MVKAWLAMWKQTFCFTGKVSQKDYWLALAMHLITIYVGVVPYALILRNFTDNAGAVAAVYLIFVSIPALSLYFRRGNSVGWSTFTSIYTAITFPGAGALLVGFLPANSASPNKNSIFLKILLLCFAVFLYSSVAGVVFYDDPLYFETAPVIALLVASAPLVFWGLILVWTSVKNTITGLLFSLRQEKQPVAQKPETPEPATTEMPCDSQQPTQECPAVSYTYYFTSHWEQSHWLLVECREEDSKLMYEPFVTLVQSIAKKWNDGQWEGHFVLAGDMRYKIQNDPLNLVYQWDDLYGIVLEYPDGSDADGIKSFFGEHYGIR